MLLDRPEIVRSCQTLDKQHGRIETRTIEVVSTSNTSIGFDCINQVARLNRTREICKSGKITTESVYLITNLTIDQADAAQIMNLKREYWAIENKLHYRKDFVFGEDRSTIRAKFGPQNMATLRNFAISFLMANSVDNVKRCVDNFKYQRPLDLYAALFQKAA